MSYIKALIMSVFNNLNNEKAGGWLTLQIAALEEIKTCPELLTNANSHKLEIEASADTIDVLPIPEKFMVNATPNKTKAGTSYNINISIDFSDQTPELDNYLDSYKNKMVIVLGVDTNNKTKVFGSKNQPLNFSYQEIQGKKLEDSSITRVTVTGQIGQKPVYL